MDTTTDYLVGEEARAQVEDNRETVRQDEEAPAVGLGAATHAVDVAGVEGVFSWWLRCYVVLFICRGSCCLSCVLAWFLPGIGRS